MAMHRHGFAASSAAPPVTEKQRAEAWAAYYAEQQRQQAWAAYYQQQQTYS